MLNKRHTQLVNRLADSAAEVVDSARRLSPEQLLAIPAEGEWSLHGTLAHLRDTETQVFVYRAARIMGEDAPKVENFPVEEWQAAHYRADEPVANILAEFRRARNRLVKLLGGTSDRDWARYAIHPEYGKITMEWLALHAYNHTLDHLAQLLDAEEKELLKQANVGTPIHR